MPTSRPRTDRRSAAIGASGVGEGHHARLVFFAQAGPQYEGRAKRRQRVLELSPVDPTRARPQCAWEPPAPGGGLWEYLAAGDRPVVTRSKDASSAAAAEQDAWRLFDRAELLEPVFVTDSRRSQFSWWIVDGEELAFTSARIWPSTGRSKVAQDVARVLRVLNDQQPKWGRFAS